MKVIYGECRECVTRKKDHLEKELHKCPHCGRFFCVEHFEPKPVHIRDYSLYSKYPEFWVAIQKETEVEDRHPCFQFTKIWVEEKDQELRLEKKLLIDWLDRSKSYRPRRRRVPLGTCPRCFRSGRTGLIETTKYDAKTMTFTCLGCGHRWTQLKAFPHDIVENPIKHVSYRRHQRKSRKKKIAIFLTIFLFILILIGGVYHYRAFVIP